MKTTDRLNQIQTPLVALFILLPTATLASTQPPRALRCQEIFSARTPQERPQEPPLKRPVLRLDAKSEQQLLKLREFRRNLGEANTTDERSEFKYFMIAGTGREIIKAAKEQFPTRYDLAGNLTTGVASRDAQVTLSRELLTEKLGATFIEQAQELKIVGTLQKPEVFQSPEINRSLQRLFAIDETFKKVPRALDILSELATSALQRGLENHTVTYTDTASTAKFEYRDSVSWQGILDAAQSVGLDPAALKHLFPSGFTLDNPDSGDALETLRSSLIDLPKEQVPRLIRAIKDRSISTFVIRMRKYLLANVGDNLSGVPSPGSGLPRGNSHILDAPFSRGITWLEFKIKASHGENALETVVKKPRFPLSDQLAHLLQDPALFSDAAEFQKTSATLKADIEANSLRLKQKYYPAEVDLALNLIRSLHRQKISIAPIGRTGYQRESYNLNFLDPQQKTHNSQITVDSNVWELDRETGEMVDALPLVEPQNQWHFQFDRDFGYFVHRNPTTGKIDHIIPPSRPTMIYAVTDENIAEKPLADLKAEQTVVTELKVPVQFIQFSESDLQSTPELRKVKDIDTRLQSATHDFNRQRRMNDLLEAAPNAGKRAFARKGNGGGFYLKIYQPNSSGIINEERILFQFNPETGYWISWGADGQTARFVFQKSLGVMEVNREPGRDWLKDSKPVPFKPRGRLQDQIPVLTEDLD